MSSESGNKLQLLIVNIAARAMIVNIVGPQKEDGDFYVIIVISFGKGEMSM
jgi:hypothetical protein